jgi:DNA-binding response OmpR family regulator
MEFGNRPGRHFILVVDANSHRGRALASNLRAAGCYAASATSAAEALRYALENEPDAVVSQWDLPDLEAVELCRRIKSARFETRVILHQEAADPSSLRRTLENGGEDLLSQPVSVSAVLGLLNRHHGSAGVHSGKELVALSW